MPIADCAQTCHAPKEFMISDQTSNYQSENVNVLKQLDKPVKVYAQKKFSYQEILITDGEAWSGRMEYHSFLNQNLVTWIQGIQEKNRSLFIC